MVFCTGGINRLPPHDRKDHWLHVGKEVQRRGRDRSGHRLASTDGAVALALAPLMTTPGRRWACPSHSRSWRVDSHLLNYHLFIPCHSHLSRLYPVLSEKNRLSSGKKKNVQVYAYPHRSSSNRLASTKMRLGKQDTTTNQTGEQVSGWPTNQSNRPAMRQHRRTWGHQQCWCISTPARLLLLTKTPRQHTQRTTNKNEEEYNSHSLLPTRSSYRYLCCLICQDSNNSDALNPPPPRQATVLSDSQAIRAPRSP